MRWSRSSASASRADVGVLHGSENVTPRGSVRGGSVNATSMDGRAGLHPCVCSSISRTGVAYPLLPFVAAVFRSVSRARELLDDQHDQRSFNAPVPAERPAGRFHTGSSGEGSRPASRPGPRCGQVHAHANGAHSSAVVHEVCPRLHRQGTAPNYINSAGTLPPLAASLAMTCFCSHRFIGAESFMSPV